MNFTTPKCPEITTKDLAPIMAKVRDWFKDMGEPSTRNARQAAKQMTVIHVDAACSKRTS
jgi:hypothetical protein